MPERVSFNEHIRPILSTACYACHGPDEKKAQGRLQLHLESKALEHVIEPGVPSQSVLIERINATDEKERMPPVDSGTVLSLHQRKLLQQWIAEGAEWDDHWSLTPPRRTQAPGVADPAWARNDYDRLVLSRLEERGLAPAPEASKAAWLRRVTLDLTGLPPTVGELDAFSSDTSPAAYGDAVDRLLASDASAENLTLKWLDNARFADSNGYQYDGPNNQWPWRDWVLDSFKANMPFDQFVTTQLAGDLLPEANLQQKIATAFNRNHGFTIEGGVTPEEYRVQYVNDRVVTFGTVFLGLTMDCARCHDHKFDDVSMGDFYSLSSFFDNIPGSGYWGGGLNTVATPVVRFSTTDPGELAQLKSSLDELESEVAEVEANDIPEFTRWKTEVFDAERPATITAVSASVEGVTVEEVEDGSWRVGGDEQPAELSLRFEVECQDTDLSSIIVQPVLDAGKIGRSPKGEAILSRVEARVESIADPDAFRDLVIDSVIGTSHKEEQGVEQALIDSPEGWWLPRKPSPRDSIAVFSAAERFGYEGGSRIAVTLRFDANAEQNSFARVRLRLSARHGEERAAEEFVFDAQHENPKRYFVRNQYQDYRERLASATAAHSAEQNRSVPVMVMAENEERRQTKVLLRGNYTTPGEDVSPAVPKLLGGWEEDYPRNRLGLARWLTSPGNPLLSRVTVNRYWQMLFGIGLVKTTEDFGSQGESPSHPRLLDNLALDLIESGWDLRFVLKKIVLSSTYRQSSTEREDIDDPENRLLARGPRFRLSAEAIRDQALFVSGLLANQLGGPSVMVYQPEGLWLDLGDRPGFTRAHVVGDQQDVHRRSMYVYAKRAMPNPVLSTFDTPSRDVCVVKRQNTNTPLQALVLRHELGFVESARVFAERLMSMGGTFEGQLERAWLMLLARRPEASELAVMAALRADRIEYFRSHPEVRDALLSLGKEPRNQDLDAIELAAMTEICRVLFNLDETVTRN